jgi:hypothetical protein
MSEKYKSSHLVTLWLIVGRQLLDDTKVGRRVKISGAQWAKENVPQVLRHRTAYLNGQLSEAGVQN